jgi:hypothetical protein
MSDKSAKWILQPQECKGTYIFSGSCYMTRRIADELSQEEIIFIISEVKKRVEEKKGADYLQVFLDESERKIFVIDQLNEEMKQENPKEWVMENNYYTILFAEEY